MIEFINVLAIEPGVDPYKKQIQNTLKAFQEAVGGYIETVGITDTIVMVCNEEGRLNGMEKNFDMEGIGSIYGPVLFCGVDGDEFASIPDELMEDIMYVLSEEEK